MEAEANAPKPPPMPPAPARCKTSGALSAQQISQYMTAETTARASHRRGQARWPSQQLRLRYTQVVAPDSGVISARTATVGAVVGVGTELFRMIRQGRLEWRAEVTARELARLRPGTSAVVKAANGSELTGKVRMIAPTVDPQTRSALVYVDLPAATSASAPFKAGMFASGQFELGSVRRDDRAAAGGGGARRLQLCVPAEQDQRVSQVKVQHGPPPGRPDRSGQRPGADAPGGCCGAGFLNDGDLVRNVARGHQAAPPSKEPP
jgi:multidrug efflux pump subunit AcrA (membrane-fusion protein)